MTFVFRIKRKHLLPELQEISGLKLLAPLYSTHFYLQTEKFRNLLHDLVLVYDQPQQALKQNTVKKHILVLLKLLLTLKMVLTKNLRFQILVTE